MRRRFTGGQIQNADSPTGLNHLDDCATHPQFRIIRVGGDHQEVQRFDPRNLGGWLGKDLDRHA